MCVCPQCANTLKPLASKLVCETCNKDYPIIGKIPVFIPLNEQTILDAQLLLEGYAENTSSQLIHDYLTRKRRTQKIQPKVAKLYSSWLSLSAKRGQDQWSFTKSALQSKGAKWEGGIAMDVGCGQATVLRAMVQDFEKLIGIDPNLPKLIIARKVMEENNCDDPVLLCCFAEKMPIRDTTCDIVVGLNVIEHFANQINALQEIIRVLSIGGKFFFDSRNRFDILRMEPHVLLPFVGFLPRSLAKRYVKTLRGIKYDVRLLSRRELTRMLNDIPDIRDYTISIRKPYNHDPKFQQLLLFWDGAFKIPVVRSLMKTFAISYDVVVTKGT